MLNKNGFGLSHFLKNFFELYAVTANSKQK